MLRGRAGTLSRNWESFNSGVLGETEYCDSVQYFTVRNYPDSEVESKAKFYALDQRRKKFARDENVRLRVQTEMN